MNIHMYYVIGWHVDIDVLCTMVTWRHTRVMQYIYVKTYMSYVSHQAFQFERFEVWKSLGLGPGPLAWAQDVVYTWSMYTCGKHFQTLSCPIIFHISHIISWYYIFTLCIQYSILSTSYYMMYTLYSTLYAIYYILHNIHYVQDTRDSIIYIYCVLYIIYHTMCNLWCLVSIL